jgi:hypothetical protein
VAAAGSILLSMSRQSQRRALHTLDLAARAPQCSSCKRVQRSRAMTAVTGQECASKVSKGHYDVLAWLHAHHSAVPAVRSRKRTEQSKQTQPAALQTHVPASSCSDASLHLSVQTGCSAVKASTEQRKQTQTTAVNHRTWHQAVELQACSRHPETGAALTIVR